MSLHQAILEACRRCQDDICDVTGRKASSSGRSGPESSRLHQSASRASSGALSSISCQLGNAGALATSATLPPARPGSMGHGAFLLRLLIAETGAGARRSSPWASGGRSRRSPSRGPSTTICRFLNLSLAKLADFLVAEGVVDDISHEGLRVLPCEEGVTFQRLKTWKTSKDPCYAAKRPGSSTCTPSPGLYPPPGPGDPGEQSQRCLTRH